jgi:hypothetical protein
VPSRWEVTLAGPTGADIPLAAPHAVVSGWLDDRPGTHGRQSGHGDQVKKWAFGPLAARPGPEAGIILQVRLLDDALAARLLAGAVPGAAVRLGAGYYRVAEPVRLVEHRGWADLREPDGDRAWQVRFVTPACARRRNRVAPLLSPDPLALGLAERWRQLDPATAPGLPWRPGGNPVWVSDLDGRTETQLLPRTFRIADGTERREEVISGFIGRMRFVCDTGAGAAVFGPLLAFASFAGAGAHTAYGFGVLVPEPTWPPHTPRDAAEAAE